MLAVFYHNAVRNVLISQKGSYVIGSVFQKKKKHDCEKAASGVPPRANGNQKRPSASTEKLNFVRSDSRIRSDTDGYPN